MHLEAYFEHFWGLLAKWLSGSLWSLIVSISDFAAIYGIPDPWKDFVVFYGHRLCTAVKMRSKVHILNIT